MFRWLVLIALATSSLIFGVELARSEPAGEAQYRIDAKTYADSIELAWFPSHVQRILAYPPAGDRYPPTGVPTLAYHDAWTTWGNSGATHVAEYVAWVRRDKEHGYAGQFMDDINFAGGNIAGTREQYAILIEAVREALGPEGILEINSQFWNLWPLLREHEPIVERALAPVNVVDKEFGVSEAAAGINTPTKYREYLEYVQLLHSKGIATDIRSVHASDEYSLATYLLVSTGEDWLGDAASPSTWWSGFEVNLGSEPWPELGGFHDAKGLWERWFGPNVVLVNPQGSATTTYKLFAPYHTPNGATGVTSVTLSGGQGVVLIG